jgi:hypothetical protein
MLDFALFMEEEGEEGKEESAVDGILMSKAEARTDAVSVERGRLSCFLQREAMTSFSRSRS